MFRTRIKPEEKDRFEINYLSLFYHICGIALCITVVYFALASIWLGPPKSVAELGDMFGFIGAVFAALAFAGVVVTIILQQQELSETRQELAKAAQAQENSQRSLRGQLENMEKTSEINILNAYINSHSSGSPDSRKILAAKKIIEKLTEKYIFREANSKFVDPKFQVNKTFGGNAVDNPNIIIAIKVVDGDCEALAFELPDHSVILDQYGARVSGSAFRDVQKGHPIHISVRISDLPLIIPFAYKAALTKRIFRKKLVTGSTVNLFGDLEEVEIRDI